MDKFDSNQVSKWLNKDDQYFPNESQVIEFKERLFANLEFQTTSIVMIHPQMNEKCSYLKDSINRLCLIQVIFNF